MLRQISILSLHQESDSTFKISSDDLANLYTVSAAQIQFLQSEYASLVVKNTFDDETSRLFKSFENHSSAFNSQSLNNLRIAADLAAASARDLAFRGSSRGKGGFSRGCGFLNSHRGSRGYNNNLDNYGGAEFLRDRRPPYERQDDRV